MRLVFGIRRLLLSPSSSSAADRARDDCWSSNSGVSLATWGHVLSALSRARGVADEMPVRQRRQVCVGHRESARPWLLHASGGHAHAVTALRCDRERHRPRATRSRSRQERSRGVGDRRNRGAAEAVARRSRGGTAKERSSDASPRAPASGRQDESGRCGAYDGIVVVYGMTAYRPACAASADLTHGSDLEEI